MMKLFLTLVAAGLLSVCLASASGRKYDPNDGYRNLTLGQREIVYIDRLLFHDTQRESASFYRVKSNDVCYPNKQMSMNITITSFQVTDKVPNDKGGYAFINEGGVGQNRVCFHLKTQRGEGYHFSILVWGK